MVENVPVPQVLIDELSNLSPFNYYLLFAITCHLSLLLNHSDKNKMDFRNLCICFQPCMKIDALCFKFLVCDWRSCWKGCKTEAAYVEQEYRLFDYDPPVGRFQGEPPIISREGRSSPAVESTDERNVSSSGSSKPSSVSMSVGAESTESKSTNGGVPLSQTQNKKQGHTAVGMQPVQSHHNMQSSQSHHDLQSSQSHHNMQPVQSHHNKVPASLNFALSKTPRTNPENDMRPLSPIKPLSPMGL